MKEWSKAFRNLTILSQFGLSLAMPLLLCLFVAYQLREHFHISYWIYLPAFFFGLAASFMTAYKFYLSVSEKEKKQETKDRAFNQHR
ncbi:AtpZ/AtpI family protein [Oribacterium sinus]|uniref:AtpZ/AtpI family protein n=1 Tax=Oribacterium sinus TaxID=237576 RepID=UPI0028E3D7A8|nr:AtpZ/AtpI family protein [Oribacterium sinus]